MSNIDKFYKTLDELIFKNGYTLVSLEEELKIGRSTLKKARDNKSKLQRRNFKKLAHKFPELQVYDDLLVEKNDKVSEPEAVYETKYDLNRSVIESFNSTIEFLKMEIQVKNEQIASLHGMIHHNFIRTP